MTNEPSAASWSEARDLGLKRYFTGKPCKHGHIAERYTNNHRCVECQRDLNRRPESIARAKRWKVAQGHRGMMLHWAKYRHKKNGYVGDFNITASDLDWPDHCPALGIPLLYEPCEDRANATTATIDRIDSSKGYVRGNVCILSRRANLIKNCGTAIEVQLVADFLKRVTETPDDSDSCI